ncbi:DNA-directed RNA polymerase subunit alpha [Aminiphilus sp.]|uniref:DNA-directed RNA polymerase subunit alpha n=1 Tax=Aminiphilus sp. TaxID=1872488 RepID=UPI002621B77B|nr:DNA-directed RNA polymerase subunit alpha [Aminiphilus sp.]
MEELLQPQIRVEESTPRFGKVIVEPLERGYGVTLGNALRRVLYSSIGGAAITAVRIEGVLHEFTTVPGVREDVIDLLLNLKHVPLRSYSKDVRVLRLDLDGPAKVTAAHIQGDSDIEFADPDAYICTLAEGAHLAMDIYVEQGMGYATNDRPRPAYLPVDALLVDAIFSPVHRVNYEVQNARVGQRTDYDRLILQVWTNGVVAPADAVAEASGVLRSYFSRVQDVLVRPTEQPSPSIEEAGESSPQDAVSDEGAAGTRWDPEDALVSRPIRDLELSMRSENCLLRGGVHTIGDLLSRSHEELLKIRNLGKISLREIEEKLAKLGYAFPAPSEDDATQRSGKKKEKEEEE